MLADTFRSNNRSCKIRLKINSIRWFLLFIFIVGYIITFQMFENYYLEYFALTAMSFAFCSLLLIRLNFFLKATFPIWILLTIFLVAYYLKFYWLTIAPENGVFVHPDFVSAFYNTDSLMEAYRTTTYAFIAFCLTSWFILSKQYYNKIKNSFNPVTSTKRCQFVSSLLLTIVPFIMLITSLVMYKTGIAVMGAESVQLPFRLAGIIFYTRYVLVPALLLLAVWCSWQICSHKKSILSLILLFLHGLSETILRSTKVGLLLSLMFAIFLYLLTSDKIRKGYIGIFFGIFLVSFILYPISATYRLVKITNEGNLIYFF